MTSQVLTDQLLSETALTAWVRLLRGHAALSRTFNAELLQQHALTINDYETLLHLSREESGMLKRVVLAERLQLTPSGVTRLLDGLEEVGLVEKRSCASDARITYAALTDAGRQRLAEASCSHIASVRALFEERYEPEELATLAELLGRLPGAAGTDAGDCTLGH